MPKPSLILLHGALGAAAQFENWKSVLNEKFDVHIPELEGHGITPSGGRPFRMEFFAENIGAYIREKGLQHPAVFGYSMGGYAALVYALLSPGKLSGIFTLATKFDWRPETAAQEVKMLDADKIAAKVPQFADQLEARHPEMGWRQLLAATSEMMLHLGANPALTAETLKQLSLPVRIAVGDRDRMVSIEESAGAYRNIPGAQFQVFPDTHHPLEQADIERITTAITAFFQI